MTEPPPIVFKRAAAADPEAFIRRETAIASPPLVPEIRLHLATEITPIWQATEATLAHEGLPPPYWAFAWPGGQALARTILDDPAIVRGKRVLDFAAGSGLVAIAAAKAGAQSVTAAEIDDFAAAAIALNAALNGVHVPVTLEDQVGQAGPWDLVLAGDVCYERPMAERVTAWLRGLVARGAQVLMGDPGRSYLPKNGLELVTRHKVPTSLELEDRTERETAIWRLLAE
ncbi:MAG TPA: 50S ribosomal protein L11 methyltransferase [Hypericibacter adhaerens]|jgi:predicted nicotinamide N-methyase|uniref:class I SAM-dependent methyltransferase n=1 Tax=Hypericibacter adhaerens TaxID=2602016 RepID=UPI002BEE0E7B|nr:50S ribosomal protein L11 methyltransferase [Hypericibacter adhaerens]HWA45893.1 50S ribosomal protein L11 methyltransferase [Hypericibacter adhaerens]